MVRRGGTGWKSRIADTHKPQYIHTHHYLSLSICICKCISPSRTWLLLVGEEGRFCWLVLRGSGRPALSSIASACSFRAFSRRVMSTYKGT